jgi:hypothetical protein
MISQKGDRILTKIKLTCELVFITVEIFEISEIK